MRKAIYPGSFDPITYGHLDVVERALRLFDEVVLAVATNASKSPLFTMEERVELMRGAVADLDGSERLQITSFDCLLVDFAREQQATAIVRGLRAVSDFEFEFQLALMNRKLNDSVETIFLMPKDNYTYLSSSILKEIFRLGGDVHAFVPEVVHEALHRKMRP